MKPLAHSIPLLLLAGLAAAQPAAVSEEQAERRLAALGTLIERSSASRQIETSGDVRALERRDEARATYRRALQAHDARDYAEAARLASESSRLMFEAARLAGRDQVTADQQRAAFDAQMQAARSLLAAQQRIGAEKPSAEAAEATRSIEALLREASERSAADEWTRAQAALKQAYLAAKASVSSMRRGDTLVRSLSFATREEEYRYELDRNDTHLMLIKTAAADRPSVAGGTGMLKTSSDKAAELRERAERAAGTGDYAAAIALLEDSTRQLVRAIRSLGIFLPG